MRSRPVLSLIAAAAFAAALFVPTLAAAQGTALGAKVGFTSSSVSLEDMGDEFKPTIDSRSGMLLGVTFRKDVGARAGVQIEGVYAQGGATLSQTDGIDTFRTEVRLHQVQIPVLVTFNAMKSDSVTLRVFSGLTFGINADDEFKNFFNDVEEPADEDEDNNINTGDTGFTIGAMVDFRKFFVDVRYTIGLNNINGGVQLDPDEPNVKTRQFAVAFGFYFR